MNSRGFVVGLDTDARSPDPQPHVQGGAPLAGEAASEGHGDETMSNIYVLYHAGCNDGFGAAWIAHKHLGDARDGRRVRYLPQSYGGEPPRMGP